LLFPSRITHFLGVRQASPEGIQLSNDQGDRFSLLDGNAASQRRFANPRDSTTCKRLIHEHRGRRVREHSRNADTLSHSAG
jgi:hypothetical protein